jgi:hypothetical protein
VGGRRGALSAVGLGLPHGDCRGDPLPGLAASSPARWPRAGRQAPAERFPRDFLPPYSPHLNPLQRVWQRTRRLALHNRYFPHRDAIVEAVETQFIPWQAPHQALRKLCAIT